MDAEEGREASREGKGAEAIRGEGRKGRGREGTTEARRNNKDGKRKGRRRDRATERRNNGHTSWACVWLRFCGGRLVSRGLFVASAFSVSASNRVPLPSHHVNTDIEAPKNSGWWMLIFELILLLTRRRHVLADLG